MTHTMSKQRKLTSRRAVAPVIATLLLVAIAVVGGSIVFVFSQGFFSSAQISGTPQIESLEFVGYDARDTDHLILHNGVPTSSTNLDGAIDDQLAAGERVAIYVQNQGINKVTLTEVRLAGTVYQYGNTGAATTLDGWGVASALTPAGSFVVANGVDATGDAELNPAGNAEIEPGQTATIILGLDDNLKEGRDAQIKISTANSAVFAGTVVAGQQSG